MKNIFSGRMPQIDTARLETALTEWLQSPLGGALLVAQRKRLAPVISRVFGYHVLQLSCSPDIDMLGDCPVCHQIHFAPSWHEDRKVTVADIESLPLATDSMDAVLLHHALDFTPDCHRLLREATRVLRPGGKLIIVGFNPLSLWGLSKTFRWSSATPWDARFISRRRLTDWLSLLDFHVENVEYGGNLAPLNHPAILNLAADLERWFDRIGNPAGAFYLIVAGKHRVPLIPVTPRWKLVRAPNLVSPLAETGRVASGRGTIIPFRPRQK